MAKFYVQSGNFQSTVTAGDAEKAALWVVHKVMAQVMPFLDNEPTALPTKSKKGGQNVMILSDTMLVSEQGFDNAEQIEFDTFDLQNQWHQLTVALAKLASMVLINHPNDACEEALCEIS